MISPSRIRIARDYNRTLPGPVRGVHILWAACWTVLAAILHPARRLWAIPASLAILALAVLPLDPAISRWFEARRPAGDLRRELEAVQQFGQLTISLLIAAAVVLLDRRRARRLLDWAAGALVALAVVYLLKGAAGRPRPALDDAFHLTGPFGLYPVPKHGGYAMASGWTSAYDLASFPSRHSCFAALAAAALISMYPRLKPLALLLAMTVMLARVVVGAHYPSDTLAGAALGALIGQAAMAGWWGVGTLDRFWRRFIDPYAEPALPRLLELDARRARGEG